MIPVRITLVTVTPLFLGGAEQNEPELRPASMRGALRYWLRAILGAEAGDELSRLHKQENAVFGTTDIGSPVVVRLLGSPAKMDSFALDRDAQNKQLSTGHDYLYYSTRFGDNRRVPFSPSAQIILCLDVRRGVYQPEIPLRQALAATWLLTHLGGFGMRAHRCAGDLQVTHIESANASQLSDLPKFPVAARNVASLQTELEEGLNSISSLVIRSDAPARKYDVLHPDVCKVWVFAGGSDGKQAWKKWEDAVNDIGNIMQKFRAGQGQNRNEINSIFGVPILHGPKHGLQRRTSPLWLRLIKLADGTYAGVATLFKSEFKSGAYEVGGGYKHIEDFVINALYGQEVNYR